MTQHPHLLLGYLGDGAEKGFPFFINVAIQQIIVHVNIFQQSVNYFCNFFN